MRGICVSAWDFWRQKVLFVRMTTGNGGRFHSSGRILRNWCIRCQRNGLFEKRRRFFDEKRPEALMRSCVPASVMFSVCDVSGGCQF